MIIKNQTFGNVIEALKAGKIAMREGWSEKGLFVFQQVPSEVPAAIIPKMTSLPTAVKSIVAERNLPLRYANQLAIVKTDNTINGWVPSVSDVLATDWQIQEHVVAGDTVGTATPAQ